MSNYFLSIFISYHNISNRLLGLDPVVKRQGAPSKDVPGEYWVRIPGETTFGQCACLYAQAGFIAHHWWVGNRCESKKKKDKSLIQRL